MKTKLKVRMVLEGRGEHSTSMEDKGKRLGRCKNEIDRLKEDTVGELTHTHLQPVASNILPCSVLTIFDRPHCRLSYSGFVLMKFQPRGEKKKHHSVTPHQLH